MPDDGTRNAPGEINKNMPAIWMLHADIPRVMQYANPPECSCWTTGCGEFDLFEVLDSGNKRMKSTLHADQKGGSSDYFERPTSGTIKGVVVMSDKSATIKILPSDYNFGPSISNSDIESIMSSVSTQSTGADMVSIFDLGNI